MAKTFKTLCDYADWTDVSNISQLNDKEIDETLELNNKATINIESKSKHNNMSLHYNIQIHLPETTNMAVYDAIFQSIKNHLM